MDPVIVVLPCRGGSERVVNKNMRPFAGFSNGLLELKLKQLLGAKSIDRIIVSSNDKFVLDYAADLDSSGRIVAIERPNALGLSSTPMSQFIKYSAMLEDEGVMLMTHVTHPFIKSSDYDRIISNYRQAIQNGFDSMFTVTRIHKFLWDESGPYNYDASNERWPRSQDIKALFDVNHAAYMIPFSLARNVGDRVGNKPYLLELSEGLSMDIDWEEQFKICEDIILSRIARQIDVIN